SFQKLQAVDTGIRAEGALTLRMSLGGDTYSTDESARGFVQRLIPALEALPGVSAAGLVSHLPLTEGKMGHMAYRPDRPAPKAGEEPPVDIRIVGGSYFPAQGIRLVAGRAFDQRDHAEAVPAMIINRALARQQFPGEDPVGKRLAYPWPDLVVGEIVGVVDDVRETSVTDEPAAALYRPYTQWADANLNVVIRTGGDPAALAGPAREVVRRIDPNLPVASIRTMEEVVGEATARSRMSSYLLAAFATLALVLAGIGLYGIVSYAVTQRRGEIGVRVALGAERGNILRLIVRQGMVLTLAGLALGLVLSLALTRLLRSLLFGVTTTDPVTFLLVPLVLAAVALLASYVPASRAARVDPAIALRGS
ncbi:MAG TPA: FtsX-like permease family protein, partial [Longimicrobium sp.]